jgi:hypothetical protein
MKPGGYTSQTRPVAESLQLMLVIIIIMKTEKRQAKNFPLPQVLAFPQLKA